MKFKVKYGDLSESLTGESKITLIIDKTNGSKELYKLKDWLKKSIESKKDIFSLDLDIWRDHRSKRANSYFWVLCSELAEKMNTTKEFMHSKLLIDYGVSALIDVRSDIVDDVKETSEYWKIMGEWVNTDGEPMTEILLIKGSRKYNTKQMSHLIKGVTADCRDNDIETLDDIEIERIVQAWKP